MKLKKSTLIYSFTVLIVLFLTVIVSNREVGLLGDTKTYTQKFIVGSACKCIGDFEIGFELFLFPMYLLSFSPEMIFFVISLFTYLLIFIASKKIIDLLSNDYQKIKNREYKYYITLFSIIIMIPIVYQAHTNAIRQGLSSLILLISFLYYLELKLKKSVVLLVVSAMFHVSSILIIPFYILFFYTNLKLKVSFFISLFLFFTLSLLYLTGYSESVTRYSSILFNIPVWELVSSYGSESSFKSGVRYDFYIFTLAIFLPVFIYSFKNNTIKSYFVFIIISTIPFLLLGWGAYSNRYLFNVWIYTPLIIICLLIVKSRYLKFFYFSLLIIAFAVNLFYIEMNV